MRIYITRSGERYGPYSEEQIKAWLATGYVKGTDLACRDGEAEWLPLASLVDASKQLPASPCPRCGRELVFHQEQTDKGTGCIVILLGILFAPLIIGIFIIIYGITLMNKTKDTWHCQSCGASFPAG